MTFPPWSVYSACFLEFFLRFGRDSVFSISSHQTVFRFLKVFKYFHKKSFKGIKYDFFIVKLKTYLLYRSMFLGFPGRKV